LSEYPNFVKKTDFKKHLLSEENLIILGERNFVRKKIKEKNNKTRSENLPKFLPDADSSELLANTAEEWPV
jgi:hypothetical protein